MNSQPPFEVGRRERQILEIVYAHGKASVSEVLAALPNPPSYSSVRAMMNLLEEKGHLRHKEVGRKFIYEPTLSRDKARRSALKNLLHTFFGGSACEAAASLIELNKENLSENDLERLSALIEKAKEEGR
jgi:BlaI family transcriptional regulator, penicillinase repressor